jgi:3-deoxy-D-manno-octulosonic-acid transferase
LLNARLSARSARRYARWPQLAREAVQTFRLIGAQSAEDAARLSALGAPLDPARVHVTGNMKFDIEPPVAQLALAQRLRARIGQRAVWLAASTREGEEALILAAWARALKNAQFAPDGKKVGAGETALRHGHAGEGSAGDLVGNCVGNPAEKTVGSAKAGIAPLLIIVPRHPQRFAEVARLVAAHGLTLQRRSEDQAATENATANAMDAPLISPATQVWLGDSMGELFAWYATADVAFIGGSLKDYGSQNLIEACAVGTPVLLGPSTFNFTQAAKEAVACGAALPIQDADDLVRQVLRLLDEASAERVTVRQNMREAGLAFARRHRGATALSADLIATLIET